MKLFSEDQLDRPVPSTFTPASEIMLVRLAELGAPKTLIAAFLEMDRVHRDHLRYLLGPVVQHQSDWRDATPSWLYAAVTAGRLRVILAERAEGCIGWQVAPEEITACLYPATMDAPMRSEYADLYLWASAQANARHLDKPLYEVWRMLGHDPLPDRMFTKECGGYHHLYRDLCRDIRSRVVKHAVKQPADAPYVQDKPADNVHQFDLFG